MSSIPRPPLSSLRPTASSREPPSTADRESGADGPPCALNESAGLTMETRAVREIQKQARVVAKLREVIESTADRLEEPLAVAQRNQKLCSTIDLQQQIQTLRAAAESINAPIWVPDSALRRTSGPTTEDEHDTEEADSNPAMDTGLEEWASVLETGEESPYDSDEPGDVARRYPRLDLLTGESPFEVPAAPKRKAASEEKLSIRPSSYRKI